MPGTLKRSLAETVKVKRILEDQEQTCAVVVSAFGGVTDQIIRTAHLASERNLEFRDQIATISNRHLEAVAGLLDGESRDFTLKEVESLLQEFKDVLQGIYQLQDLSDKTLDFLLSFGERLSATIIARYVDNAVYIDSRKIIHTDSKFGDANFKLTATLKNYFGMYAKGYGLSILMFGALGLIIAGVVSFISSQETPEAMGILIPVIFVFVLPVYLWMFAYFQTKRTNLVFGNLVIQEHKVQAELKVGAMMLLYLTNTLAIMFTLGLMMPWAKIRTARYKASVMSVIVAGNLGQFVSTQAEHQSALGEEIGEMFDMDLGF